MMADAIDELVDWQLTQLSPNLWTREIFEYLAQPSETYNNSFSTDAARWIPGKGWTNKI
jgi:hypothetical protein